MRKVIVQIVVAAMIVVSGCAMNGNNQTVDKDTVIDNPGNTQSTTGSTARDNGNKTVVDGYWVKERKYSDNGTDMNTVYVYIPLKENKQPGYYDFEDAENHVDWGSQMGVNRPDGTNPFSPKKMRPSLSYYTPVKLGFNQSEEDRITEYCNPISSIEAFSFNYQSGDLYNYDVQCITIVLYKELYENYPDMKLKIYGMQEEERTRYYNQKGEFDGKSYTKMLSECRENGFSNCELVGEKEVTETGKFYIDYQNLTDKYGYDQYLIAMEVSETSGFAYYLNAFNCYEVEDRATFDKWKKENSSLLIGE